MRLLKDQSTKVATGVVLATLIACGDVPEVTVPEPPRAASLSIAPAEVALGSPGETAELTITVLDQHGNPFTGPLTWTSDDASVASVDETGIATAVSAGNVTIRVVSGNLRAAAQVSVSVTTGVCDRTPQVRDALVAAVGRSDCSQVSSGLLGRLRRLDLGLGSDEDTTATAGYCADTLEEEFERDGRLGECGSRPPGPGGTEIAFHAAASADGEADRIPSLRSGDFQGLHNLQFLDLSGHFLRGLPDSVFADLAGLDTLDLRENRLAALPRDVFGPLTGLEYLDLSDNVLTALPDSSFAGMADLNSLFLDENWFTALPDGIFADLTALDTLWLGEGELRTLPDGVFDGLGELRALDLSENRLSTLPDGAFHDLDSLEYLTLSVNRLTELRDGVFDSLTRLRRLSFRRNRLSTLPEGAFDNLGELNYLSIGRNRLTKLPDGAFTSLTSLDTLSVTQNRLSELPRDVVDGLTDLDYLSFSFNDLTELPAGLLDHLGDLTTLYLSRNELTRLPDGVFDGTPGLETLSLFGNQLTELPRGAFAGLSSLERLWLEENLVDPLPLTVEARRTDNVDPLAAGPAELVLGVREGAPFEMVVVMGARGGEPRSTVLSIAPGDTVSRAVTVSRRTGSLFQYVVVDSVPETPTDLCRGALCFEGMSAEVGNPLVLANPDSLEVQAEGAYLIQATQSLVGQVPLVADRQALLRVFGTGDNTNSYHAGATATFYIGDEEVHVAELSALVGLPGRIDESSLDRSFNAMIPASVIQPGLEMVVEIDPDGDLPAKDGSELRLPETGRTELDVRRLPPMDVTLVPVAFGSEASKPDDETVAALVQDMAGDDSRGTLRPARALLPMADLNVTAREPYISWADTLENGGIELLDEIRLLRHIEVGATDVYYHGVFAHPATRFPWDWGFGGIAYIDAFAGLSLSHLGGVYRGLRFAHTLAHELGHNLSLRHTPCGGAAGADPQYPYTEAFTGIWGVDFTTGGEFGRLLSPARYRDFMSYCEPEWTSDYSFMKALEHRLELPPPPTTASTDGRASAGRTLLLWGRVQEDGELRLEPVFEWDAPVRLPESAGPYRLDGVDANGASLFSLSFAPDQVDHGGAGFLFAVPAREAWADNLQRVTLTGPEGSTTLDHSTGPGGGAIVTSRATGRVLSIVRDWSEVRPDALGTAAEVAVSRSVFVREVRERNR